MKKRVLFVIDSLTCGGAEKSLVSLLPLLSREKYELYIWMRTRGGDFEPLLPKDVKIAPQPSYTFLESVLLRLAMLSFSMQIRWNKLCGKKEHGAETLWKRTGWAMKVPQGQWDVVVAYQQGIPTYLVANKFHNCKKLAWVNVNLFKAGYNPKFNSRYYAKMDKVILVSEELCKLQSERMPQLNDKYEIIYDVLNPHIIRKQSLQEVVNIRRIGEIVIVTVGRLAPPKNHILAVETAAELKKNGIHFKWYFVGEGSERTNIEEKIRQLHVEDNVTLLGLQTNPYAYMRQADIYVQTSSFEGFGLTIGEAKILGLPVVSTNFEVVHNQITHGKNGLIAEMNAKSLASAICRLISDDVLRKSIMENVKQENNMTYLSEGKKVESLLDA